MVKVLVFRPNFDTATRYGNSWLGEVTGIAIGLGHDVMDLEGSEATPENFYDAMNSFQPDLIIAVGHGNNNNFSGQNKALVLTGCTNDQIMSGSQAFMLSCLMGIALAPSMVSKGAISVLAFTSEFIWLINPDYQNDIANDPYAKPFKDAVVEPCRRLLSGATWQQVYDQAISLFNKGISNWFSSPDPSAGEIVSALTQDRDNMVVYGEKFIGPSRQMAGLLSPFQIIPVPLGILLLAMFL